MLSLRGLMIALAALSLGCSFVGDVLGPQAEAGESSDGDSGSEATTEGASGSGEASDSSSDASETNTLESSTTEVTDVGGSGGMEWGETGGLTDSTDSFDTGFDSGDGDGGPPALIDDSIFECQKRCDREAQCALIISEGQLQQCYGSCEADSFDFYFYSGAPCVESFIDLNTCLVDLSCSDLGWFMSQPIGPGDPCFYELDMFQFECLEPDAPP